MLLRADFSKPEQVDFDPSAFVASPSGGVARFMLDRVGEEVARATSIVRFEAGAEFSPHTHDGGEEFVVLDGVFSDAYGDFPAGSYVRNPIGSHHRPGSKGGCTIFVKLWQMSAAEKLATRLDAQQVAARAAAGGGLGGVLYDDTNEKVSLAHVEAGTPLTLAWPQGGEVLILEGAVIVQAQEQRFQLAHWSWLRLPPSAPDRATVTLSAMVSTRVWLKQLKADRSHEAWAQRAAS